MMKYILLILVMMTSSCTIIYNSVADSLSGTQGGGNTFTRDNDPELVKEALPFTLKMYETLLEKAPKNANLHLSTGSGFISYANAFVDTPASMLPATEFQEQKKQYARAKKLYLRGRSYVLKGIELKHPGFGDKIKNGDYNSAFAKMKKEDVPFLYWAAAGWMAAFSVDAFDFELSSSIKHAIAMMNKALELDDAYDDGAIHEFFITYYGVLPESMGGSEEKARYHFKRALELSGGTKAGPYVSLATTISIKNQNIKEFTSLLNKALEVDIDQRPDARLVNIIAQQKAKWFLDNKDEKFLME